jgi:hypothetical protein
MMKKNNKRNRSSMRLSLGLIFAAIVTIYVLYVGGEKSIENYRLKSDGICAKAKVTYKNKVGGKGVIYTHYRFEVSNKSYEGYSSDDDSALVGDSIMIVYLKSNPNVNRSNTLLQHPCTVTNQ